MTLPNAINEVTRYTGEVRASSFDFTDELAVGESHSSVAVAVTPAGPTLSSPQISNALVNFVVTAGTSAGTYYVRCTSQTSNSNTIIGVGQLVVRS